MAKASRLRTATPASVRRAIGMLGLLALGLAACAPQVEPENACPFGNVTLTGIKDADAHQRFTSRSLTEAMAPLVGSNGAPSCALAVVADNRIATLNGYGDPFDIGGPPLDPNTPALIQTRLYVGSIAKTITALAALRLAEEQGGGGLASGPPVDLLDRPLSDLYPPADMVPQWATLTLREYLAHSGGVPKDPNPLDLGALNQLPASTAPDPGIHPRHAFVVYRNTTPRIAGFQQQFTARYSNIGYSLVGAAIDWQVVDDLAGNELGYERYVFEKIGLNDSTTAEPTMVSMCLNSTDRAPKMSNRARGFDSGGGPPLPAPNFEGWEGPSGGWTMTIGDLARLMIIINTNARISETSRDEMFAALSSEIIDQTQRTWGLGIWRENVGSDIRYGKGGDITGFTADFIAYRDAGVGGAIVCNADTLDHDLLRGAIRDVIDPCLGEAAPAYCNPP